MAEALYPTTTRVLVTDDSAFVADKICEALAVHGFQIARADSGAQTLTTIKSWSPHFVIYDLGMKDINGPMLLKKMKAEGLLESDSVRVFMTSAHNSAQNVKDCLRSGASDYLVKPVKPDDIVSRLILHMQKKRQIAETAMKDGSAQSVALHYLHLTELLMRESLKLDAPETSLYHIVGMLSLAVGAVRVSVIQAQLAEEQGNVRASNDKKDIDGLRLDMLKYPEVTFALRSEKTLALDNLKADPTMANILKSTKSIQFNAMIVCPIRIGSEIWGVLSARLPDTKTQLTDFEIRFTQLAANVVGSVLARHPAKYLSNQGKAA